MKNLRILLIAFMGLGLNVALKASEGALARPISHDAAIKYGKNTGQVSSVTGSGVGRMTAKDILAAISSENEQEKLTPEQQRIKQDIAEFLNYLHSLTDKAKQELERVHVLAKNKLASESAA